MYLFSELNLSNIIIIFALWGIGGWLMLSRHFEVSPKERGLVGFGLGLVVSNMLVNFTARWMPLVAASWLAAFLTIFLGILLAWPLQKELLNGFKFRWQQWLWFGLATWLFTLIGRGLAIFDDYQNLPAVSIMAAGDIPPHFPLRPDAWFGYHYFLLLLAAQIVQVGSAASWVALDFARGLVFTLTFSLTGILAWLITKKRAVAIGAAAFAALAAPEPINMSASETRLSIPIGKKSNNQRVPPARAAKAPAPIETARLFVMRQASIPVSKKVSVKTSPRAKSSATHEAAFPT